MARKKVFVLLYHEGRESTVIAVFKKKPSDKALAKLELGSGLDTVEGVREAFDEYMSWDKADLY